MKKLFTLLSAVLIAAAISGQAPEKFSYQAVVRNSGGVLVQSHAVGIKISILQGSAGGSAVYAETHTVTTNTNGLATLEIGAGTPVTGTFSNINWNNGPYFLLTETDPTGGTSYTIAGTSELLSTPFALSAKSAETADYNTLSNKPVLFNGTYSSLTGTPTLATVATTGSYNNLTDKPLMFSGVYSDLSGKPALFDGNYNSLTNKPILFDGVYNSLTGKPTIPTTTSQLTNNSGFISSYTETDPIFAAWNKSAGISITASQISDFQASVTSNAAVVANTAKNSYPTADAAKLAAITGSNTGDQDLSSLATITALTSGLNTKVDKVGGKGLSTEDYTTAEKIKLTSIATGAEVNVNADWNAASGDAQILNKPAFATVAATGSYSDLINKPLIDGSETRVTAGTNVIVTGDGTSVSPYIVNASGGGSGWGLSGNAGTVDGTNFIGTTDIISLNFKVNNQKAGRIDAVNLNTFFGYRSGNANTTGTVNTAVGQYALEKNTTGHLNNAFGGGALGSNTTGHQNVSIGYMSLSSNTSGNRNIAVGHIALGGGFFNANENIGIGYNSLYFTTIGNNNIALGSNALNSNTAGSNGIAIGYGAMQYSNDNGTAFTNYNVAVGYEALRGSTNAAANTGTYNSTIGYQSLWNNTSGNFNSALGTQALYSNTTGSQNSAFGWQSLYGNVISSGNTAQGHQALRNNNGSQNTAVGVVALLNNTTGGSNTAIGAFALSGNTLGNFNTAIGASSGDGISTGSLNVTIGYNAQVPNPAGINQVRIGSTSITYAGVQVAWTITSDKRLKSDIQESNLGLDFITSLKPVSYFRNNDVSKKREYGLIAQDLEESLNLSGVINNGIVAKDDEGMYSVRYNDLMAPMIKAIQEQQKLIKSLQEEIGQLKGQNEQKLSILSKLEVENAAIKSDLESRLKALEELVTKTAQK